MSATHPLEAELATTWPPEHWRDLTALLAVSGGGDSVALMRAMVALRGGGVGRLVVAHFNHNLRGDESAADEAFVVRLSQQLDLPCRVGRAGEGQLVAESRDGLEAAARAARYWFLEQTAAGLGARYAVTAHTADDQAETILHRVLRGTGIGGLAGMERARPLGPAAALIRPLLDVRRAELIAYLDDLGQPYRRDSSNQDTRLTRNRIRHDLLPQLARQFNPAVIDALLRLGRLAGEAQATIGAMVDELSEQCVVCRDPQLVEIDAARLAGQTRHVIRELLVATWRRQGWALRAMGFTEWDQLASMVLGSGSGRSSSPPKQVFPGRVLAEPDEGRLTLRRLAR